MAQPALATFDYREHDKFIVRFGVAYGTGTAAGTTTASVLNQIKSVSGKTTASRKRKEFPRVGTTTVASAYGPSSYTTTLDFTLYHDTGLGDYKQLTGDTVIPYTMDTANSVQVNIEVYDDAGAYQGAWVLTAVKVIEAGPDIDSDADAGLITLRMESASRLSFTTASANS